MKNNKSPGPDDIYSETFHLVRLDIIFWLFNYIVTCAS